MIPLKYALTIMVLLVSIIAGVHADDALWQYRTQHDISCLEISPDASYIVAGGERIYCTDRDGSLVWREHSGDDLQFLSDGSIVVGLRNNFLHFIDLEGQLTRREEITEDVGITDIIWMSDDGTEYFVLGSNCRVYAKDNDESLDMRIDRMEQPSRVLMNGNTARIIAIEEDGLHCYNAKSGSRRWEHTARGEEAAMTDNGAYVIYGAGNRIYGIRALHGETGERKEEWQSRIEGEVLSIDLSNVENENYLIAIGTRDATQHHTNNFVYLLDSDGREIWKHQCEFWINDVDITPSGNYIGAASLEKKVFVFDKEGNLCKEIETSEPARFVILNEEENFGVAADAHNIYGFTLEREATAADEANATPATPPTSTPAPVASPTRVPEPPANESKIVDRGAGGNATVDLPPVSDQSGTSGILLEVQSALVSFFRGIFAALEGAT